MLDDDIVHGAEKTSDNNYNLKTDCNAHADLAEIEQCTRGLKLHVIVIVK